MDEKEVLTRFKNGHLDRAQAVALPTGATGAAATGPAPVVLHLPDAWPEREREQERGADAVGGSAAPT
ncbi:hypothetical protein OG978_42495 (plasmid) [Streptomyces sp. NBC_01591]|uniref:hypothetical protein n=1 Tax=Streptomyces sp. NBC_01591 TaxID=2975888 RepID=UPI002DD9AFEA|nr:hypothetical protein [Streptomyces sp. NBC_01591]WSD73859.1 hypothetical protein OG978_42495 [Streptomyces sp. NBC_01591]